MDRNKKNFVEVVVRAPMKQKKTTIVAIIERALSDYRAEVTVQDRDMEAFPVGRLEDDTLLDDTVVLVRVDIIGKKEKPTWRDNMPSSPMSGPPENLRGPFRVTREAAPESEVVFEPCGSGIEVLDGKAYFTTLVRDYEEDKELNLDYAKDTALRED